MAERCKDCGAELAGYTTVGFTGPNEKNDQHADIEHTPARCVASLKAQLAEAQYWRERHVRSESEGDRPDGWVHCWGRHRRIAFDHYFADDSATSVCGVRVERTRAAAPEDIKKCSRCVLILEMRAKRTEAT